MSREMHFVIAVNVDTKEIYIDDDTYTARFTSSESYFDTNQEKWFEDLDQLVYGEALEILNAKAQLSGDS